MRRMDPISPTTPRATDDAKPPSDEPPDIISPGMETLAFDINPPRFCLKRMMVTKNAPTRSESASGFLPWFMAAKHIDHRMIGAIMANMPGKPKNGLRGNCLGIAGARGLGAAPNGGGIGVAGRGGGDPAGIGRGGNGIAPECRPHALHRLTAADAPTTMAIAVNG